MVTLRYRIQKQLLLKSTFYLTCAKEFRVLNTFGILQKWLLERSIDVNIMFLRRKTYLKRHNPKYREQFDDTGMSIMTQ